MPLRQNGEFMESNAQKAYAAYKKTAAMNFVTVTTARLNVIYNIACRMERDEEYKAELDAFETEEGKSISELIESYFTGYNARHGLEIRETLTEFADPDLAEGGYFMIETYKLENGESIKTDPTRFSTGDSVKAVLKPFSNSNNSSVKADKIKYIIKTDDGEVIEGEESKTDALELNFTLSRPGWVYFKADVTDGDGKKLLGFDSAFGGVLFDFEKIPLSEKSPEDLYEFWEKAIDRLLTVDPRETSPDSYEGLVKYEYDMPKKNFFKLVKFDKEYIDTLRDYGIVTFGEEMLEKYDFYELNLKAPGPCHSSNYLTVPKGKEKKSLPLLVTFDGYSAYPIYPSYKENTIVLHCSHHGYDLPNPLEGYYMKLRRGVCMHYGLGNGSVNSLYEDLNDNYMIYLHQRNLQAVRYVTDPNLSAQIENLHELWNGEVKFEGGSMGGYQAICTAALCEILVKKSTPFKLSSIWANIPAFCNLAGRAENRVPCMTYYTDGMEYFDCAHLSAFVKIPLKINRVGLGDTTCSPGGVVAMFNNIPKGVHKEINFLQNSDHGTLPEEDKQQWSRYTFD